MQGQAKQSKIYRTEIMHMPICTGGKKSEIYRTERLQMLNMDTQGKQSKIYRTEIQQMSICKDEESKGKYAELKQCRC